MGFFDEIRFDATKKMAKDYYNQLGFKQSYFSGINSELRFESSMISKYKSFEKNVWLNQLGFGFYF